MVTTRVLPREEWEWLDPTLIGSAWSLLPDDARVVVVERDGAIVACSALFTRWHQEGTWIAEADRGDAEIGRRLVEAIKREIRGVGATEVIVMTLTPSVARLCRRLGTVTELVADHFAVAVEG